MTLLFVLALAMLVALLQRHAARRSLTALEMDHFLSAQAVEPGAELELTLVFRNRGWGFLPFLRYWEYLPDGVAPAGGAKGVKTGPQGRRYLTGTTWLLPRQRLEKHFKLTATARGCYSFNDLTVYGGDFLGLKEEAGHFNRPRELVIYPAAAPAGEVSRVFGGFLGDVSVRRFIQEDPVLTLGSREYTGREPMKAISWTQSARRGELMVKNYDHTLEPMVSVLLNIQGADHLAEPGDVERCYSLTRSVCEALEARRVQYDFRTNALAAGELQPPEYRAEGLGSRHFYGILEGLGRGTYMFRVTCETMVERALGSMTNGRGIIFITPGDDPRPERLVRRLAAEKGGTLLVLTAREAGLC